MALPIFGCGLPVPPSSTDHGPPSCQALPRNLISNSRAAKLSRDFCELSRIQDGTVGRDARGLTRSTLDGLLLPRYKPTFSGNTKICVDRRRHFFRGDSYKGKRRGALEFERSRLR